MCKQIILTLIISISAIAVSPLMAGDPFRGQSVYTAHCAGCHGGDGAGVLSGTPSFKAGSTVLMKADSELLITIRQGFGVMPGFNGRLKEDQIYDVITYIRTFF